MSVLVGIGPRWQQKRHLDLRGEAGLGPFFLNGPGPSITLRSKCYFAGPAGRAVRRFLGVSESGEIVFSLKYFVFLARPARAVVHHRWLLKRAKY